MAQSQVRERSRHCHFPGGPWAGDFSGKCWSVVRTSRGLQCLEQEQLFLLAVLLSRLTPVLKGLSPEVWVLSPCSPCSCVPQRPLPRRDCFCGARGRRPRIRTSTCRTSTSGECPATASQPISFPRCVPPAPDGDLSSHLPSSPGSAPWVRAAEAGSHAVQAAVSLLSRPFRSGVSCR